MTARFRTQTNLALLSFAACAAGILTPTLEAEEAITFENFKVVGTRPVQLDLPSSGFQVETTRLGDFAEGFGNVHLSDSGAGGFGALTSVRGLSNTPYFSDPALGVYLDDLPLGGAFASPAMLLGYNQAELIRGPGGTFLAGRGAVGGTLFLSSSGTGHDKANELSVHGGDAGALGASAATRITKGRWSAAANLGLERDDGYLFNTETQKHVDTHDHLFASGRFAYLVSTETELALQVLATRGRDGSQPLVPLGQSLRSVARPRDGRVDSRFEGVALRATTLTDLGTLSSITSYTHWQMSPFQNSLDLPPVLDSVITQGQSVINEEVRLRSPENASYPWFAGLWFSDSTTLGTADRSLFGAIPIEGSSHKVRGETWAAFGESVLMHDEGWTLTGGFRAERIKKKIHRYETVPGNAPWVSSLARTKVQPRFMASWDLDENNRAEFAWSLASKPGGFSAFTSDRTLGTFKPEETQAFEGSWRARTNARTVITLRGFHYRISDYQVERSFTASDYLVVNAPRAKSTGAELEGTLELSPRLTLSFSGGFQEVKLGEFKDPFTSVTTNGKRAPYAPRYTLHAAATYSLDPFTFEASATQAGKTFFDEGETKLYSQDTYTTVDLAAAYRRGRWTLEASARNLLEADYYTLIIPGIDHGVPGAPRTLRLTLRYHW